MEPPVKTTLMPRRSYVVVAWIDEVAASAIQHAKATDATDDGANEQTSVATWDIIDATQADDVVADKDGAADVMVHVSRDEGSSKGTCTPARYSNAAEVAACPPYLESSARHRCPGKVLQSSCRLPWQWKNLGLGLSGIS